jgi:hypothetical protein
MQMNSSLYLFFLSIFFLTPPIILGLKFFGGKRVSWWLIFMIISAIGWLSINATVYFYFEHLTDLLTRSPNNFALQNEWQNDGAMRVFALLFGWLYGLIYSLPWLIIYWILRGIQNPSQVKAL